MLNSLKQFPQHCHFSHTLIVRWLVSLWHDFFTEINLLKSNHYIQSEVHPKKETANNSRTVFT